MASHSESQTMTTKTRIYLVTTPSDSRLVRAPNASQAIRHVARDIIEASVADQDELVLLVGRGVKVEACGEDETAEEAAQAAGAE